MVCLRQELNLQKKCKSNDKKIDEKSVPALCRGSLIPEFYPN